MRVVKRITRAVQERLVGTQVSSYRALAVKCCKRHNSLFPFAQDEAQYLQIPSGDSNRMLVPG